MGETDGEVLAALDLRRDADLEIAYQRHAGELHRFATRHLRDAAAAADVVQEVFVRAWRHAARYDGAVASLRVWLFTIARNLVVDQVRRDRARPGRPTDPGVLGEVAERASRGSARSFSDDLVTAWFVEEALGLISVEQRVAIVETALRGRPYAEVAVELDVPVGTLRSRVFHGLRNLRAIMDDTGVPL
ncbi:RNA polymerase sigma factor [Actinomycetospora soli]|uniref:RNA polymerase sigma factor n=1 Tax=Actinomycetospora soli TaxID=2893887 RepID=UPI001E5C556D|nr:sigma-70 family RNA polymerase sigma factor [Actinomycetospora soli]MCD2189185.1 sigma-70 family RNA polymerase sigma factor [Actinomycetospora soli]